MRVLQIGKFYPILGGVEKVMYDLATGLGCDMLCASADGVKGCRTIKPKEGGTVFVMPTLFKAAGTMISPKMISWLKARAAEYDIIDIHHPDPMAALALRMSGYKGRVILHWHSDIIGRGFFMTLYKPLQSWLIRRAERIVGTTPVYVSNSPYLKDVQDKTTYMPIGVDALKPDEKITREIKSRFEGKKLIFSLGRLVPYKGYDNLIKAAASLPDDYRVVIGGSGPLRGSLQALIDELGLSDKVSLAGFIDDAELPSWFDTADAFVLPSVTKNEAFGIVQIEAMSVGTPVVATKIKDSGVSWVNKDGVSGLNVNPGDPTALAKAIVLLTYDKESSEVFRNGARARFDNLFTKEKMIKRIQEIYEKQN